MPEFAPTRKNWKDREPNPLTVLFPEVTDWVGRGAPVRTIWIYITLALLPLLVYLPAVWHDFVALADFDLVRDNPHVATGLTAGNILWAFRTGHSGLWQPLTWLSHMRDCQFFGANPAWQHFGNMLLHTANTLLLCFVLNWFTGERWRSGFVAALFALHPLNVETVAWIAERKDLLGTTFFLLSILAYGQYLERRGIGPYLIFVGVFALGLMTSPIVVTLPFVLFLIDYWPLRYFEMGLGWRRIAYEKLPLIALSFITCIATFFVHRQSGVLSIFDAVPRMLRIENALSAIIRYLGKIFWPANLLVPYRYSENYNAVLLVLAAILVLAISAGAILFRRTKPYLITGWFWYLGTLVPVLGLIQIGAHAIADRYTYIPAIGIFIGATWLCADLFSRWQIPHRLIGWMCALLLCACIVKTSSQLPQWENTETLLKHTLALDPKNYLALEALGNDLLRERRFDEATLFLKRALTLAPNRPFTHAALGTMLYSQGEGSEAADHFEKALHIVFPLLDRLGPLGRDKAALFMNNFAWLRATWPEARLRNGTQAVQLAEKSVALTANTTAPQLGTLAAAQAEVGKFDAATKTARQALALAQSQQATALVEMLQQCLSGYQAGRSVRQSPKPMRRPTTAEPESPALSIDVSAPPNQPLPPPSKTPLRKLPPLQEPPA